MENSPERNKPCECWNCDLKEKCVYVDKFQRLPRERNGLGKCAWLKENNGKLQY